jgi:hypothetical protein
MIDLAELARTLEEAVRDLDAHLRACESVNVEVEFLSGATQTIENLAIVIRAEIVRVDLANRQGAA